jgi:membrane-associated protein
VIVFCETGLVVTPFLPGDSLLFAVGSMAAIGALDVTWSILLLIAAAILGDTVNYSAGNFVGPKVFHEEGGRFLNREYLLRTHRFYERHGGKTIILARFLPIIRTFAPVVAGVGRMHLPAASSDVQRRRRHSAGSLSIVLTGYWFGTIPVVQKNFSLVILALVLIPAIPSVVEVARIQLARRRRRA